MTQRCIFPKERVATPIDEYLPIELVTDWDLPLGPDRRVGPDAEFPV